jgi:hypothetical protein
MVRINLYTACCPNALPPKDLGVATSSQQFTRTLGGTIGVAVAGAIVTSRLISKLESAGDIYPQCF